VFLLVALLWDRAMVILTTLDQIPTAWRVGHDGGEAEAAMNLGEAFISRYARRF